MTKNIYVLCRLPFHGIVYKLLHQGESLMLMKEHGEVMLEE